MRSKTGSRVAAAAVLAALLAGACSSTDERTVSDPTPSAVVDPTTGDDTTQPTGESSVTAPATDQSAPAATEESAGAAPIDPVYGGTLRVSGESEVANPWTPAAMQCDAYCHQRARTFFEPLTAVGVDDQVHGVLAESFVPNDDFTQWTVTVRPGITFHDGTPLDAPAVVANLQSAGSALLIASALNDVAKNADGSLKIDTVDDRSFVVHTGKGGDPAQPLPWPTFPYALSTQWGLIASPTWLDGVAAGTADPAMPVGTGPFRVVSYAPRDRLVVERNDDYWMTDPDGNPLPYLDRIEFRVIEDSETAAQALRSGDIDMFGTINGSVIQSFRDDPGDLALTERTENGGTGYLLIDLDKPGPLQDRRVRCALAYAIDRQELIDLIGSGVGQVANGLFSPGQEGHLADNGFDTSQRLDEARALIDEYEAETGTEVTFLFGTSPAASSLQLVELIRGYWEQIGVDAELVQVPVDQLITRALFGDPEFEVFTWVNHAGLLVDEQYYWWHSSTAAPDGQLALNFGRIRDDIVDTGLEEARSASSADLRRAAAERVNRRFVEQCYQIPMSWGPTATVRIGTLQGLGASALPDGTIRKEFAVGTLHSIWIAEA